MQVLNPNFSISFNLLSIRFTLLTSPVKPTSPTTTVSFGILKFLKLDATDNMTPKSTAGSETFIPLTTFKYTSWGDSGFMDMNQLITSESYNKVDFTDEELDNSGFAGLEGKFINENTFIGVQKYHLSSLKSEIPEQFIFQTKIKLIENYGVNAGDISSYKWGTWAFKVPVTVDKNLSKTIDLDKQDFESDTVKVNSMKITPFEMIVDLNYKEGNWTDYRTVIYDENGEILQFSQSTADENNNTEKLYFESPNSESTSIRVVVEKPILGEKERWENKNGNGATYEEIGKETVFDKVIQIK